MNLKYFSNVIVKFKLAVYGRIAEDLNCFRFINVVGIKS